MAKSGHLYGPWREIFVCFGILAGMVVPIIGESECFIKSRHWLLHLPFDFPGVRRDIHSVLPCFLCWDVKERPSSNVPGQVESLVPGPCGMLQQLPLHDSAGLRPC